MSINELQISALSRINFCFYELKKNPPREMINAIIDKNSINNSKENYINLSNIQQKQLRRELFKYLDKESTTEARIMLVINYLSALLLEGKNNKISIHNNFDMQNEDIQLFYNDNKNIINKIKTARDKYYAHIDIDWQNYAKDILFDEFEICINYLIIDLNFRNI